MSKKLVWVTNDYENYRPNSMVQIDESSFSFTQKEWESWRSQFIEGAPQATRSCTVAELKAMGMIGLYEEVEV